jgi:PAS domain S-box-containing protein
LSPHSFGSIRPWRIPCKLFAVVAVVAVATLSTVGLFGYWISSRNVVSETGEEASSLAEHLSIGLRDPLLSSSFDTVREQVEMEMEREPAVRAILVEDPDGAGVRFGMARRPGGKPFTVDSLPVFPDGTLQATALVAGGHWPARSLPPAGKVRLLLDATPALERLQTRLGWRMVELFLVALFSLFSLTIFVDRYLVHPLRSLDTAMGEAALSLGTRPLDEMAGLTGESPAAGGFREIGKMGEDFQELLRAIVQKEADRGRAEKELKESNEFYEQLLSMNSCIVWRIEIDPEGRFRTYYVSSAAERLLGLPSGTIGNDLERFLGRVHPEDLDAVRRAFLTEAAELRPNDSMEFRVVLPGGEVRRFASVGTAWRNDSQRTVELYGIMADVTEKRKVEEHLRQQQRLEGIGTLAGGIAHDFNNLLTPILGCAELALLRVGTEHPAAKELRTILDAAQRGGELTRQILAFSRKQRIETGPVELNDEISRTAKMLSRTLGERIDLCLDLAPGLPPVLADAGQLHQVLLNLAVNGRDAMEGGGVLTLSTRLAPPAEGSGAASVILSVGDTGAGMDGETLARIFEPFFTTKEAGKGTGLGLSTVHGIVKQHGGDISVASKPGEGTVFTLRLPAAPSLPKAARAKEGPLPRGTGRVLLVEDEASVRILARRFLEEGGYEVVDAEDAREALSELRREDFDLLLTDVVLPGEDGRELYRKAQALRPGLAVLYMSGYAAGERPLGEILGSGVPFLPKPFDLRTLLRAVREVLSRRAA